MKNYSEFDTADIVDLENRCLELEARNKELLALCSLIPCYHYCLPIAVVRHARELRDKAMKAAAVNAELLGELKYTQQVRANECDEFLKLKALNAELLAACKRAVEWRGQDPEFHSYVVKLIAKAEANEGP